MLQNRISFQGFALTHFAVEIARKHQCRALFNPLNPPGALRAPDLVGLPYNQSPHYLGSRFTRLGPPDFGNSQIMGSHYLDARGINSGALHRGKMGILSGLTKSTEHPRTTQGAQNSSVKECTLSDIGIPHMIQGIFLN